MPVLTPAEIKRCRKALGLSQNGLGQVLKVHGRTIRRWECGEREIPGPVEVLMLWLAHDIDPLVRYEEEEYDRNMAEEARAARWVASEDF